MFGDGLGNNLVSGGQNPVVVAQDEAGGDMAQLMDLMKDYLNLQKEKSVPQSTSVPESTTVSTKQEQKKPEVSPP